MYVKFSFLELVVKVPHCWSGIVVNLVGKPSIVEKLPEQFQANTYIANEACPESEVNEIIAAVQAELQSTQLSSDYNLAKSIANSLKTSEYLEHLYSKVSTDHTSQVEYDNHIAQFNSANENKELIVKDYYYDCGFVSKDTLEHSINVLGLLFNSFDVAGHGGENGIFIVASDFYPKFNPILDIFAETIRFIKSVIPEKSGTLISKIGFKSVTEQPRIPESNVESDQSISSVIR